MKNVLLALLTLALVVVNAQSQEQEDIFAPCPSGGPDSTAVFEYLSRWMSRNFDRGTLPQDWREGRTIEITYMDGDGVGGNGRDGSYHFWPVPLTRKGVFCLNIRRGSEDSLSTQGFMHWLVQNPCWIDFERPDRFSSLRATKSQQEHQSLPHKRTIGKVARTAAPYSVATGVISLLLMRESQAHPALKAGYMGYAIAFPLYLGSRKEDSSKTTFVLVMTWFATSMLIRW